MIPTKVALTLAFRRGFFFLGSLLRCPFSRCGLPLARPRTILCEPEIPSVGGRGLADIDGTDLHHGWTAPRPLVGTVMVVDRHPLTRHGMCELIAAAAHDLRAIGVAAPQEATATDGATVVLYNANHLPPSDARIVADLECLRRTLPDVPITVLSSLAAPAADAARLGLRGQLLPSFTPDVLVAALRLIIAGGSYFPPADDAPPPPRRDLGRALADLTLREAEVLTKLCQGKANKIIAYELDMSENTVKVHVYRIMKKLGASNRTEVVSMVQRTAS